MKISEITPVTITDHRTGNDVSAIQIYMACQYRWEESANPEIDDVFYSLDLEDATKHAKSIKCEIGFHPVVTEYTAILDPDDLEEDQDFENLDEIIDYFKHSILIEDVYTGDTHRGNSITGAIVIEWSWEKHVGYCRNLLNIGTAGTFPFHDFETENDLISGNEDRTFRSNFSILLTKEEITEAFDLREAIEVEINKDHWKWNYFEKNPISSAITSRIEEITEKK